MNLNSRTETVLIKTVSLLFAASISTSGLLAEEAKSPAASDSESSHSQLGIRLIREGFSLPRCLLLCHCVSLFLT
jgi:hypothetical protein